VISSLTNLDCKTFYFVELNGCPTIKIQRAWFKALPYDALDFFPAANLEHLAKKAEKSL